METDSLISKKHFPEPLSFNWRCFHSLGYLTGGLTFVAGSVAYFPGLTNYLFGGLMFTIGSAGFLYADLKEWWTNNRAGCAFDQEYHHDFENQIGAFYGDPKTFWGQYRRKENGMNFAFSAFGSLLYLIGSIMFIPSLEMMTLGTNIFIYGSLVIFLSQTWKVYRQGLADPIDVSKRDFSFSNYLSDLPALGVDSFAGLGGFAYMVGSMYFLPQYDINDHITFIAALWFTIGGICFSISGFFILYRYFCTLNYHH